MVISVTYGAGEENRTLVPSLENSYSTIELHPQFSNFIKILSETGELNPVLLGPKPSVLPMN